MLALSAGAVSPSAAADAGAEAGAADDAVVDPELEQPLSTTAEAAHMTSAAFASFIYILLAWPR